MLAVASPCSASGQFVVATGSSEHPDAGYAGTDLDSYRTLKALYQETCRLISFSASESSDSVGLALRRCEADQQRLEHLLSGMGYDTSIGQSKMKISLESRMRRYFKRTERATCQASYRDAILLLRDVVMR